MPVALLVVYCLLVLLVSLVGGWLPLMVRLTHRRMQLAVSMVAGLMLGVGLLHLLPHALLDAPDATHAVFGWVLVGFLVMFFTERYFCFHHHEAPSGEESSPEEHHHHEPHALTWSGAAVGLTLHTVINGVALAASVEAETRLGAGGWLAGLGTFLVIFLHKPLDSMTISMLMTAGGWSLAARHVVNAIFALMIPLGVVLFYLGLGHAHEGSHLVAYALAFSAGTFLCIAGSDLLPELQFHTHDRGALSLAVLAGLALSLLIGAIESGAHDHNHDAHPHEQHSPSHDHNAHSHDHEVHSEDD